MSITINGTTGIAGVDGSAGTPAVQGTDTNTGVFFGTDLVYISTGGTAAVTVDSGQRTKFPTTIGVGGATPSTSGSGITFPATQSASSNANTLDDYEEGSFDATAYGSSTAGTTTYGSQSSRYTKIGNQVTIAIDLTVNSMTGTGDLRIGGLPFTGDASGVPWVGSIMSNNLDWPSGTSIVFYINPGNNYGNIWSSGDNIGWAIQAVDSAFRIIATTTYFVAT